MTVSRRDREAVFVHHEGRSALTGEELGAGWELDHRVPRAAGGTDALSNLQPLTAEENRAKSCANPPELRGWQRAFFAKWNESTADNFLLVALPGAGKTIAALTVARRWIAENPGARSVLIVVPTDALRTQWQQEAAQLFGLQFQTREFTGWKPGMVGAIVTYQLLAGQERLWSLKCQQRDVLVICDEIHHGSDANDWGVKLREAVGSARRRLVMSGTPFRGDSRSIPFVSYDTVGECVPQYRYDYPEAIRDGVIRVVCFQRDRGTVRQLTADGEVQSELSSELSDAEAAEIFSRLLQPGKYTEELLRRAHAKLVECRQLMPDAGALAICKDQQHAQEIAAQLERITGTAPDLIVSDDERATSTVESFRSSTRPWVVAVRQISEGVDIKRLKVLAYLTNYCTALFFRQAVGRIVRVRTPGGEADAEAYCFIPDHPVLVRHAAAITQAQVQAILDESDREFSERVERQLTLFDVPIVLGTEHTGSAGAIIEGEHIAPEDAERIRSLSQKIGASERAALEFVKLYRNGVLATLLGGVTSSSDGTRSTQRPLELQQDDARVALGEAVKRVAYTIYPSDDAKFATTNMLVNRYIGKPRRDLFGLEDCHRAIRYLDQLLVDFKRRQER